MHRTFRVFVVALLAGLLFTAGAVRGEIVGSALLDRPGVDSGEGLIFVNPGAMTFDLPGSLLSWEMFAEAGAGRQITPLLFDETAPNSFDLIGIGATQTISATGLQSFPFDVQQGTDSVAAGNVFGWRDGNADGSVNNPGTISGTLTGGLPTYVVRRTGIVPNSDVAVLGATYDDSPYPVLNREYSIQATTDGVSSIIAPTAAVSTLGTLHGAPIHLINGNGLIGAGPALTLAHESTYLKGWLVNNGNPANELIFSWPAGQAAELTEIHVWQYEQAGCCLDRGVSTFDISFSSDNGSTYSAPVMLSLDSAAVTTGDEFAQTRALPAQTGVTHVRITNMAPQGDPAWLGLNEIRFTGAVAPIPPYSPPAGSAPVGNDLSPRTDNSDGATGVFNTNFVPMPDAGAVDSVSVYFQGDNQSFELHQLRPTGNPDEYEVVYSSGNVVPFGTPGQVESFPLPGGPVEVLAGDIFGHYGRGVPFSTAGGLNANNPHPIYYNVLAENAPQVGDLLTINDTAGASSRGPFPIRTDLSRDYALAVNFTPVPEPSGGVLLLLGMIGAALGLGRTRQGRQRLIANQ